MVRFHIHKTSSKFSELTVTMRVPWFVSWKYPNIFTFNITVNFQQFELKIIKREINVLTIVITIYNNVKNYKKNYYFIIFIDF